MQNRTYRSHGLLDKHRKLAVENLKRCPVCGTVNAILNHECFVCRWHGSFECDPASVEEGLLDVLDQCPELLDCILHVPKRGRSLVRRVSDWLRARLAGRIDFHA